MSDVWMAVAAFEASTPLPTGGVEVIWIPANARLESVVLPADPVFGDPEGGSSPVTFDFAGREYAATVYDFKVIGGCYPLVVKGELMPKAGDCYQSTLTRRACAKCGRNSVIVHMPIAHVGYYCPTCCPACNREATGGESLRRSE